MAGESVLIFDGDRVTISLASYKRMLKAQEYKLYLETGGVDNWQAYHDVLNDTDDNFGQSYWEVCEVIDRL